ncbi:MAG: hypothetical protein ABI852_13880 [Gemmatimonadaceae bacterium]
MLRTFRDASVMHDKGVAVRRNDFLIGALASVIFPLAVSSQVIREVAVGNRVRVLAPSLGSEVRDGVMHSLSSGHLRIKQSSSGEMLVIPANQLMRLDVWGPGSGTQAGKGAAIGAITGGILFGIGGYVATRCPGNCSAGEYGSGVGTLLAIPGAGVGALVGALIGRSQRSVGWQRVELPLRLSITPPLSRNVRFSGSFVF